MRTILVILMLFASTSIQAMTELSAKQWHADIDVYARELVARHIDPFHTLSQHNFNLAIDDIKQNLISKSDNQVATELMALTRKINDGHTSLPLWGWQLKRFPLSFKMVEGELYCVETSAQYAHLLGAKLLAINGVAVQRVIQRLARVAPFIENQYSTRVRVAQYISYGQVLNGLGIIPSDEKAIFELQTGQSVTPVSLNTSSAVKLEHQLFESTKTTFKPIRKHHERLWFGVTADHSTVFVEFEQYPSMSEMEHFAQQLLSFVKANQVQYLVIDLRDNYGGDFFVGLRLAQYLVQADAINWMSGVYTLINNVTFSAAMSNAAQYAQLLNATLVGEPSGANPSGYQDMGQFVLPNSQLMVTYSKRLYHFSQSSESALSPDITIEQSIADKRLGYDRQLDWVIRDIERQKSKEKENLFSQ